MAAPSVTEDVRARAAQVARRLAAAYPQARCELDYGDPWQLLVATVLSAQCTDERVNRVTPVLFSHWPDVRSLAAAAVEEVEETVRPTGFFRNKARNLVASARLIVSEHAGEVPSDMEALVALPGVGRKTAKVVLGEAFGIAAGVAVDTHVKRLSRRLGLSDADDPERVATCLESLLPQCEWISFSLRLILHGRRVCGARKALCGRCSMFDICPRIGI